jgi:hypothetical protein
MEAIMNRKTYKEQMEDLRIFLEELEEKKQRERLEIAKREEERERKKFPNKKEAKIVAYLNRTNVTRRDFVGVVLKQPEKKVEKASTTENIDKNDKSMLIAEEAKKANDKDTMDDSVYFYGDTDASEDEEEHYVKRNGEFIKVKDLKKK